MVVISLNKEYIIKYHVLNDDKIIFDYDDDVPFAFIRNPFEYNYEIGKNYEVSEYMKTLCFAVKVGREKDFDACKIKLVYEQNAT